MRGLSINVQLIVLIVVDEAAALLEDGEVRFVTLREKVQVVPVRQLRPHFDRLSIDGVDLPQRVDIRPVALLTALAQSDLRFADIALQVVVNHVEVLERRELRVGNDRWLDEELALLRVDVEAVTGVDADPLAHAVDEPVHLQVEVCGIVDHVEVRVADPSGRRVVVQLPRQLDPFGSAGMILLTIQTLSLCIIHSMKPDYVFVKVGQK